MVAVLCMGGVLLLGEIRKLGEDTEEGNGGGRGGRKEEVMYWGSDLKRLRGRAEER